MSRSGKILTIFSGFVLVVVVVVLAAAWYYASAIEDQALAVEHESDPFDLRVASIDGGRITLETTAEPASKGRWAEPGIWGLESADTYNQVGSHRRIWTTARWCGSWSRWGHCRRRRRSRSASTGMRFRATRGFRMGSEFQEVGIPSALGTFPAWLTPGGYGHLGDTGAWQGSGAYRVSADSPGVRRERALPR